MLALLKVQDYSQTLETERFNFSRCGSDSNSFGRIVAISYTNTLHGRDKHG